MAVIMNIFLESTLSNQNYPFWICSYVLSSSTTGALPWQDWAGWKHFRFPVTMLGRAATPNQVSLSLEQTPILQTCCLIILSLMGCGASLKSIQIIFSWNSSSKETPHDVRDAAWTFIHTKVRAIAPNIFSGLRHPLWFCHHLCKVSNTPAACILWTRATLNE